MSDFNNLSSDEQDQKEMEALLQKKAKLETELQEVNEDIKALAILMRLSR